MNAVEVPGETITDLVSLTAGPLENHNEVSLFIHLPLGFRDYSTSNRSIMALQPFDLNLEWLKLYGI